MSICSTVNRELQGIHIGGLEDDYKEFVLGELTELWDSYY